jgi:hypothetical protein
MPSLRLAPNRPNVSYARTVVGSEGSPYSSFTFLRKKEKPNINIQSKISVKSYLISYSLFRKTLILDYCLSRWASFLQRNSARFF